MKYTSLASRMNRLSNIALAVEGKEASFGVTVAQFEAFGDVLKPLQMTYAESENPAKRTTPIVQLRDQQLKAVEFEASRLLGLIRNFAGLDNAQREVLGLPIAKPRVKTTAPTVAPYLQATTNGDGMIEVIARTTQSGKSRARLPKTQGLVLYTYVGADKPTDLSLYTCQGQHSLTRQLLNMNGSGETGDTVWITGYWFNTAGTGPAAMPISTTLLIAGVNKTNPNLKMAA